MCGQQSFGLFGGYRLHTLVTHTVMLCSIKFKILTILNFNYIYGFIFSGTSTADLGDDGSNLAFSVQCTEIPKLGSTSSGHGL